MLEKNYLRCPVCESDIITEFFDYPRYRLVACENCRLIFQENFETADVSGLLSETYDSKWVAIRHQNSKEAFTQNAGFYVLLLEIFCPGKGNILEIGSGTGEFLFLARESGWKVEGVEPSYAACNYATQMFGLEMVNKQWDSKMFSQDNLFDCIVFWHVLEHIASPLEFLKDISGLLKPSGVIVFCIPNSESLTNEIYGKNSPLFTEPDHLFHYNRNNLRLLLEKAGLKPLTIFSRQEPLRLEYDIKASKNKTVDYSTLSFNEKMGLMAQSQSCFKGHELFCVAAKV